MSGKILGLLLLTFLELVCGLGAKSEAMACRARAEVYRRNVLDSEYRTQEYLSLLEAISAPSAVSERHAWFEFLNGRRSPEL